MRPGLETFLSDFSRVHHVKLIPFFLNPVRCKIQPARYIGAQPCIRRPNLPRRSPIQIGSMKQPKPHATFGQVTGAPDVLSRLKPSPERAQKNPPLSGPPESPFKGAVIKIRGARVHNLKNID